MATRILIADDHPPTRMLIRTMLEAERPEVFELVEATNGAEAIRAFETQGPFDLILLDVTMPDMDGYAACARIREIDGDVPVVFVTAMGDLKDYTSGRNAGGDSYIVKPFARASLRSIVSQFTGIDRKQSPPRGLKA